jgi:nucleotide-binding universal stress UspA family protein
MKIVMGYEGNRAGDAALADLRRAGLPSQGEMTVFTVADVWPSAEQIPPPDLVRAFPYVAQSHVRTKKLLVKATGIAQRGAARVRQILPGWRVTAEATADSPAWAIFKKARDAGSDVVIVGSRPRSGFARWILGSVSQKVLAECPGSVRIARARAGSTGPVRILLAVDGSRDAECAVTQVLERHWPANTAVRVIAVAEGRLQDASRTVPSIKKWVRSSDSDPNAWLGRYVESVERRLVEKGLVATGRVREGNPKTVLLELASRWRADAVFLGARGLGRWERIVLGSVSTAVAVRAPCSVEVVRSRGKGRASTGERF